jgi:hypothetical protein
MLSDSELNDLADNIAKDLEEAAELREKVAFLSVQKMPCPECAGAGSVYGGSLGDICPTCMGRRVVDHPGADGVELPDLLPWQNWLRQLDEYRGAAQQGRALPPPGEPPSHEDLKTAMAEMRGMAKSLKAPELPAPPPPRQARLLGSLSQTELDDEELDELEAEAEETTER